MRQNEKRIYSGWELLNANEVSSGTPIRLKINPLPAIFGTLTVFAMLYGCYLGGEISAFYLQKFTDFLLIPKVLNLPILQDRGLYSTVGYLVFGYIGFAFFLDWVRFIERTCLTAVFLRGDILSLETRGLFGKNVFRWNCRQSGIQIVYKTGLFRRFFGLERIVIVATDLRSERSNSEFGLYSPFFFRAQNRNLIRGLFKN
ncbi:LIC20162 family protein [Leptospira borgpetersenii]|uniref:LIC20162 family protein n=1 Tax=Leptospira borgpetersenii TaxID=174 RepID=UPI000774AFF6|nr:hypothetical protein [Leptospira borgpetersenii]MBE8400180.1 hypothetical protein [Leptospira borgpetersenii serovar Tarassovi]MBE8402581.1 hypothetical protein [Leptospira borgpetersenii serovar Tarassovi]MBE8406558.1 hypothetical protein [Leptospira borgpetersenii serovar Tarassovi]MBE8411215.1 hypothetical protein [Leptospira borgpetersenii serovar Tarassovi]MBE8414289.1 hypothetical protein [Leptospira borgpetersenii serovar Tarassovi]